MRQVSEKAANALGRVMPNVGGPSRAKRAMLMTRMLYTAPVWASQTTQYGCNRDRMQSAQRIAALRKIRAYITVSAEAAMVLAGSIPADLIAGKRKSVFLLKNQGLGLEEMAERYRRMVNIIMTEWQNRRDAGTTGSWTRRLLPDIRQWL